jgi:Grx4 family monothiol glutaredoxin
MSGEMTAIKTGEEFQRLVQSNKGLVVVHFLAPWAPQCQQVTDVILDLAKEKQLSGVLFLAIEAESLPELSLKYDITAVPTCVILKNGQEIDRVNGVNVGELSKKIHLHAPPTSEAPPTSNATPNTVSGNSADPKLILNERLKALINKAPMMVFIKGSPDQPKCGFSRTLVDILSEHKAVYESFDILSDEQVRQGLKEFSNWPTYPQVYVRGELVGGLDIIKELVASGELKGMIPSSESQGSLDDRLRGLVNKDAVMLFMKGSPGEPKCGFSRSIVDILNSTGTKFSHFDILQDNEVREGLRTYSNWPTYPQLYVKGELIGGLDIVKELRESGELESILRGDSQ